MPPKRPRPKRRAPCEFALRLRRILEELSYAEGGRLSVRDAARAIDARTAGRFTERKLRRLLYEGATWTAADLRRVADGLRISPMELLYDVGGAPASRAVSRRKRKGTPANNWDEIDRMPTPER